jgi:hypothetical protein
MTACSLKQSRERRLFGTMAVLAHSTSASRLIADRGSKTSMTTRLRRMNSSWRALHSRRGRARSWRSTRSRRRPCSDARASPSDSLPPPTPDRCYPSRAHVPLVPRQPRPGRRSVLSPALSRPPPQRHAPAGNLRQKLPRVKPLPPAGRQSPSLDTLFMSVKSTRRFPAPCRYVTSRHSVGSPVLSARALLDNAAPPKSAIA